jgi:hypothetical protein
LSRASASPQASSDRSRKTEELDVDAYHTVCAVDQHSRFYGMKSVIPSPASAWRWRNRAEHMAENVDLGALADGGGGLSRSCA